MEPPKPYLIRTPRDAEAVACDWLRYWGFHDAQLTPPGADGGVDVESDTMAAQVKMEGLPTGRPKVQQLVGAAARRVPVFFALGGYLTPAIDWAYEHEVALFTFDFQGVPEPVNIWAEKIAERHHAPEEPSFSVEIIDTTSGAMVTRFAIEGFEPVAETPMLVDGETATFVAYSDGKRKLVCASPSDTTLLCDLQELTSVLCKQMQRVDETRVRLWGYFTGGETDRSGRTCLEVDTAARTWQAVDLGAMFEGPELHHIDAGVRLSDGSVLIVGTVFDDESYQDFHVLFRDDGSAVRPLCVVPTTDDASTVACLAEDSSGRILAAIREPDARSAGVELDSDSSLIIRFDLEGVRDEAFAPLVVASASDIAPLPSGGLLITTIGADGLDVVEATADGTVTSSELSDSASAAQSSSLGADSCICIARPRGGDPTDPTSNWHRNYLTFTNGDGSRDMETGVWLVYRMALAPSNGLVVLGQETPTNLGSTY